MLFRSGVGLTAAVGRNVGALIVRQVCDSSFVDCGIVFALILHEERYNDMTSAPSTRGLAATAGGVGGDGGILTTCLLSIFVEVRD